MLKITTVQPISLDNNLMKSLSAKSQNKPDMIELIVDIQEKHAQYPVSLPLPVPVPVQNLKNEANTNANNLNMNEAISTSLPNNSSTSMNVKSGNVPIASTNTPRRTSRSY